MRWYLELCEEFGCVTLILVAFPAAVVCIFCISFEMLSWELGCMSEVLNTVCLGNYSADMIFKNFYSTSSWKEILLKYERRASQ